MTRDLLSEIGIYSYEHRSLRKARPDRSVKAATKQTNKRPNKQTIQHSELNDANNKRKIIERNEKNVAEEKEVEQKLVRHKRWNRPRIFSCNTQVPVIHSECLT